MVEMTRILRVSSLRLASSGHHDISSIFSFSSPCQNRYEVTADGDHLIPKYYERVIPQLSTK